MLDGLFVQPRSKAVVFSQWTRTHHVVIRRLEQRGFGHVSFHGDVPADKRPALVLRFKRSLSAGILDGASRTSRWAARGWHAS